MISITYLSTVATLLFLSLAYVQPSLSSECDQSLRERYIDPVANGKTLIESFDPREIRQVQQIGTGLIFKVLTIAGNTYMVRFPSEKNNLDQEVFTHKLIERAPNLETIGLRYLNPEETLPLLATFPRVLRQKIELNARMTGIRPGEIKATVTHYVPTITGHEYLRTLPKGEIPTPLKTQIISLWALHTLAGISDFHPLNWLYLKSEPNNVILPIDMALPPKKSTDEKNAPLKLAAGMDPFGRGFLTDESRNELLSELTDEIRDYISQYQNEDAIRSIYRDLDLPPNEAFINPMARRARALILNRETSR